MTKTGRKTIAKILYRSSAKLIKMAGRKGDTPMLTLATRDLRWGVAWKFMKDQELTPYLFTGSTKTAVPLPSISTSTSVIGV